MITTYQIIKKGDGTFFPNMRFRAGNYESNYGAWYGYCETYDEAFKQLEEQRLKDEKSRKENAREVVYQYPPEQF